jgi:peptide/nickel transport system ATP-binding protein
VVQQVTDEILVMQSGRVVERGETLAVLSAPKHECTRRLLDAVPRPGWVPGRQ